jgi:hypothetical protein
MSALGRASFAVTQVHGNTKSACMNNPTSMAVGVLCAAGMKPGPLLASFLEAGGIAGVVRLLRKSTDPAVLVYASSLISNMVYAAELDGRELGEHAESSATLANMYYQAGEWEMAHTAILRVHRRSMISDSDSDALRPFFSVHACLICSLAP